MNKPVFMISCLYLSLPALLTFTFSTLALASEPDPKVIAIPEKAATIRLTTTKEINIPRLVSSSILTAPPRGAKISVDTPAFRILAEVKPTLLIARPYRYNPSRPITASAQDWAKGAVWVPANSLSPEISPRQPIDDLTPVFTESLDFRVFAHKRGLTQDGAGIDSVNIAITDNSSGVKVHQRLEKNPGYCPFGGGEPECNVLNFARSGYRWPNGTPIQNGSYQVELLVNSKDPNKPQLRWFFNFEIQR